MKQNLERNKGFTLIELLAVIVILAIIALIAVPVVMNIINKANKSAFKDSAYGLIKAGELFYTDQLLTNAGLYEVKTFTFPNDTEGLELKGSKPTGGYVTVNKKGQVSMAVTNGKYCVTKDFEDEDVTISDGNCELVDNTGDLLDNSWPIEWNTMEVIKNTSGNYLVDNFVRVSSLTPSTLDLATAQILANLDGTNLTFTYIGNQNVVGIEIALYEESSTGTIIAVASVPAAGDYNGLTIDAAGLYVTNMGYEDNGAINANVIFGKSLFEEETNIVYYNPNKAEICTKNEWGNNTDKNGKSGCMRWYVYGEEDNKQKLILDHNTTNEIAWISDDDYVDNEKCGISGNYAYTCNDQGPITLIRQLDEDTKDWKVEANIVDGFDLIKLIPYFQELDDISTWQENWSEFIDLLNSYEELLESLPNLINNYNTKLTALNAVIYTFRENMANLMIPNVLHRDMYINTISSIINNEQTSGSYWTKTPLTVDKQDAMVAIVFGFVDNRDVNDDIRFGLRPVIKISK